MTLVSNISPTGIKAMRERISAESRAAHTMNRIAVQKRQWSEEAYRAGKGSLHLRLANEAFRYLDKRDDHMETARRCKWELENA